MATFASVDEYIASFPPEVQRTLQEVRAAIHLAAPGAEERISYNIPAFALGGRYFVSFAGWKKHVSLYPIPDAGAELAREIAPHIAGKGTLKFSLADPMPLALIHKIAARLAEQRAARSA